MRAFYDMQRDVREGRERGNLTQQRHADVIIYPERMNLRDCSFQALLDTRESYRFLRSAIPMRLEPEREHGEACGKRRRPGRWRFHADLTLKLRDSKTLQPPQLFTRVPVVLIICSVLHARILEYETA